MIPTHVARELAAAKRCEYEHRAAVHRLARQLAAVDSRPRLANRVLHRVATSVSTLLHRRPTATPAVPVVPATPATGVECCARPCAA